MVYFPFLNTTIIPSNEIDYTNITPPADLVTILDLEADNLYAENEDYLAKVKEETKKISDETIKDPKTIAEINQTVIAAIPLLQEIENIVRQKVNVLPPSGAMAGIYSLVDKDRGVWKAPANVALSSVISPTVLITDAQQGDMNKPVDGKAVNAIRTFIGRGNIVWGARTLDGNSKDYRYINVRRTLIYIEQSIKIAANQYVFEPNDASTWVAVKNMIDGFLTGLWEQGGLMGDKASDAFQVSVGLGSTMTPDDVLEGYMIVQVLLQMVRPAEFIELTFKQKMEG